jgi:hypothetical protein
MKRIYKSFKQKLNESRKAYNKIVLGEQFDDIQECCEWCLKDGRGRPPKGCEEFVTDGGCKKCKEDKPESSPPSLCPHPNDRKIKATSCETGASGTWGCATVNDGVTPQQIPQVGQVISGFGWMNNTPNIPLYYKIIQVDPGDPSFIGGIDFDTNPLHMGCGFDCDMNNYSCSWNSSGNALYNNYNSCMANCVAPISGCTDSTATNYDPLATFDDGSCIFPCMKVTLINTCPQNSSYSTYYGTPGVPSPGGTWNMNWGQGPNFGCATIDGQTPDTTNLQTFIEGGTGVPGEQWEVFSIEPPTSNYVYNLNTTSC